MPKAAKARQQKKTSGQSEPLKGWQQIADFLGEPVSVVQRWGSEGMPVRREGRYVQTSREELNAWLGRDAGSPVRVITPEADLAAELKRGLLFVRQGKSARPKSKHKQG